jgi:hemin uptake protein HemP
VHAASPERKRLAGLSYCGSRSAHTVKDACNGSPRISAPLTRRQDQLHIAINNYYHYKEPLWKRSSIIAYDVTQRYPLDFVMGNSVTASNSNIGKTTKVGTVEISHQRVSSEALFSKLRELVVTHGDHEYKLRLTANNKLILTK